MRKLISLSLLLTFMLLCSVLPIATSADALTYARGERKARHQKGAKVGTRVRQLRKHNKNLHRALADFERNEKRNGNKPRIDESESFMIDPAGGTAAVNMSANGPLRKVSYKPQEDFSGYGLEVIVITTYEAPGEWQGTLIFNKFDPSGGYLGEYVANVIIGPDPTNTLPDVIAEISYEDGQAYLEYGEEYMYGELGDPGEGFQPPVASRGRSIFEKASFQMQPGRLDLARRIGQNPRVRGYVKCTWAGSVAGAAGCGAVSAFFAGSPFIPCFLGAATGANTICGISAIFF
ncbi:MAG: hypothetical protein H7Z16_00840 [Pyrinomonadaceae bacterium]|nr:hypothetical protein [Pyrinomonadaceae bacterium]